MKCFTFVTGSALWLDDLFVTKVKGKGQRLEAHKLPMHSFKPMVWTKNLLLDYWRRLPFYWQLPGRAVAPFSHGAQCSACTVHSAVKAIQALHCDALHCTALYNTILRYVLYDTALSCTALYCTKYYTTLHYTVLSITQYCTILY